MPAAFSLAPDVSFCRIDERIVLLQLGHDKYFQLTGQQARWFLALQNTTASSMEQNAQRFGNRLRSMGILNDIPGTGLPLRECSVSSASMSLLDYPLKTTPTHSLRTLLSIIISVTGTAFALKRSGPGKVLKHLSVRKELVRVPCARSGQTASKLAAEFLGWSPFFFTSHDACLYRSLAMTHYLLGQGIAAECVIAVRCQPFRAHSWVQYGGIILNDHLEITRDYRPIFSV